MGRQKEDWVSSVVCAFCEMRCVVCQESVLTIHEHGARSTMLRAFLHLQRGNCVPIWLNVKARLKTWIGGSNPPILLHLGNVWTDGKALS